MILRLRFVFAENLICQIPNLQDIVSMCTFADSLKRCGNAIEAVSADGLDTLIFRQRSVAVITVIDF